MPFLVVVLREISEAITHAARDGPQVPISCRCSIKLSFGQMDNYLCIHAVSGALLRNTNWAQGARFSVWGGLQRSERSI